MAFARLDWESNLWYNGANGWFGPWHVRNRLIHTDTYTISPLNLLRMQIFEASLAT